MTSGSIRLHASVLVLACLRPSSLSECEYISPFLSLSCCGGHCDCDACIHPPAMLPPSHLNRPWKRGRQAGTHAGSSQRAEINLGAEEVGTSEENYVSLNPRMKMRCAGNKIPFAKGEKAERPKRERERESERGQREIRNRPPELHGRYDRTAADVRRVS